MGVDEDEEEGDESDLDDDYNPKSDVRIDNLTNK